MDMHVLETFPLNSNVNAGKSPWQRLSWHLGSKQLAVGAFLHDLSHP